MHKLLIEEDREAFDKQVWPPKRPKLPQGRHFWGPSSGFGEEGRGEIDSTIEELKAGYEDVIKAGDLAFRLENGVRVRENRWKRGDFFGIASPS